MKYTRVKAVTLSLIHIFSEGGISLCRDGFHMSIPYGRYLLACVWMKTLLSVRVSENPYVPETGEGEEAADRCV